VRDELLVRLLAAEREGSPALLDQIARQEAEYRRYAAVVEEEACRPVGSLTRRLAHEAALGQAEAHLRWLERCRAVLEASAAPAARAS
jgi:hypothetical protein